MKSWRDEASERAQEDLDELVGAALEPAQEFLERYGEFFPFAVTVGLDGEVGVVAGVPDGASEQPESAAVIDVCVAGLLEHREQLRAAAVVSDVRVDGGDAVCVDLEHAEGPVIRVLLPWAKRRLGRGIRYGDLVAVEGEPRIWR